MEGKVLKRADREMLADWHQFSVSVDRRHEIEAKRVDEP